MNNGAFNRILHEIYGCARQPGNWHGVLDRIRDQINAKNVALQLLERKGDLLDPQWTLRDSLSYRHRDLHDKLVNNAQNPRLNLKLVNPSPSIDNHLVRDEDLFDPHCPDFLALRQRLRLLGMGQFLSIELEFSNNRQLCLVMHKSFGDKRDFKRAEERFLLNLAPHLLQAVELFENTHHLRQQAGLLEHATHQVCTGIVLMDTEGRLQWSNRFADNIIQRSPHILVSGATLRCADRTDQKKLAQLIDLIHCHGLTAENNIVTIGALSDNPLQILATPASAARYPDCISTHQPGTIALYLNEHESTIDLSRLDIAVLFGLTPAESRLATALYGGASLNEYAEQQGISSGTARIQLKSIFSKTNTNRQADLIKLLCTSICAKVLTSSPKTL